MAERFHINRRGTAALCRAKDGNCPLGSGRDHYATREEAQTAFEESMNTWTEEDSQNLAKAARTIDDKIRAYHIEESKRQILDFLQQLSPPVLPNLGNWNYAGDIAGGRLTYSCVSCKSNHFDQRATTSNVAGAPKGLRRLVTGMCVSCGTNNAFLTPEGGILHRTLD